MVPPLRRIDEVDDLRQNENEFRESRTSILRDLSNTLDLEYSGIITGSDSLQIKRRSEKFSKEVNDTTPANDENVCPQNSINMDSFATNKFYEALASREILIKRLRDNIKGSELGSVIRREKEAQTPKECEFGKPLPFTVRNFLEQSIVPETLPLQQRNYKRVNISNFVVRRRYPIYSERIDECNVPESDAEELTSRVDGPNKDASTRQKIANFIVHKYSEHEPELQSARSIVDVVDNTERITAPLVFKPPKNSSELFCKTASFMNSKDRSLFDLLHESRDQEREVNSFIINNTSSKELRFNHNSCSVVSDLEVANTMSERRKLEIEMDTEIIKLLIRYKAKFELFDKQNESKKLLLQ